MLTGRPVEGPERELIALKRQNFPSYGSAIVAIAMAREHDKASPLSGTWSGPAEAFECMDVIVKVEEL